MGGDPSAKQVSDHGLEQQKQAWGVGKSEGGEEAEGSPMDGKLALVNNVSSPASAVVDSNQSHQALVQRWEGLLLAGGHPK